MNKKIFTLLGKVIRIGNSLGYIIPSPVSKALELTRGDVIEVTINEQKELILRKKTNGRAGWEEILKNYTSSKTN